jgi:hypothetical protein
VVAATVLLVLAGASGCTSGRAGPAAAPPASGPPVETGTARTAPTSTGPDYPTEPQEYAERAVAAWAAPDLLRLAELAAPQVHRTIVELPGPPDLTWTFIRCEAEPGSSGCAFYNQDGDRLVLTLDHRRLGGPRAAVGVTFEVTGYPDRPVAYLREFVAAWRDGNLARMQNLAAPAAVEVYAPLPPPPEVGYRVGATDGPLVEVVVSLVPGGEVVTWLSTGLLGQPQAIRTAALDPAAG